MNHNARPPFTPNGWRTVAQLDHILAHFEPIEGDK